MSADPRPPPPPSPSRLPATKSEQRSGAFRLIGNVLWLVLAGVWMAMAYALAGVVLAMTIIGIPFGIQSFKLAGYSLWPFGRAIVMRPGVGPVSSCVGNVVWFALAGVWLALGHLMTGALLCLTVIGIPFGIASFRLARLALWPFGMLVVPADSVVGSTVYVRI